ncbi:BMP family ABC transporter substrate-binding protein [Mycoplasma sp. 394]
MTKKFKKFVIGFGTPIAATTALIAASCGTKTQTPKKEVLDIPNPSNYINPNERVATITKDNTFTLPDSMVGTKIYVITDTGHVTDKSFNQSQWEAALTILDQTRKDGKNQLEVKSVEPREGKYDDSYRAALTSGAKIWVLSGFTHIDHIKNFIQQNNAALKQKGVKIFNVDFALNPTELNYPDIYNINFNVNEASWMAGYALAKYVAENETDKKLSSFGGGAFHGVTDYITGYLKGILEWNKENPSKKVTHEAVRLDSGFQPGPQMDPVITSALASNPVLIYPVAGPATKATLDKLNQNNQSTYIVGVDVDQGKSLSAPDRFLTSVLKNMAQAVYDSILEKAFGDTKKPVFGDKNSVKGDFAEGWVGLAPSSLKNTTKREKMNEAITAAETKFRSLTADQKAFIDSNKATTDGTAYTDDQLANLINSLVEEVNK